MAQKSLCLKADSLHQFDKNAGIGLAKKRYEKIAGTEPQNASKVTGN